MRTRGKLLVWADGHEMLLKYKSGRLQIDKPEGQLYSSSGESKMFVKYDLSNIKKIEGMYQG